MSRNTDALCFLYSAVPPPFCGSPVAPCMLPSNMVCWQQPMAWPVKGEGLMRGRFCRETVVSVLSSGRDSKIWKGSAYKYPMSCSVTALILAFLLILRGITVKLAQGARLAWCSSGWVPGKAAAAPGTTSFVPEWCGASTREGGRGSGRRWGAVGYKAFLSHPSLLWTQLPDLELPRYFPNECLPFPPVSWLVMF